ncbi:peroxiredoxin-like family protein [Methylocaldum sp. GT1TLB]|jgi:peroxiredoxin|uniref:peroxiredoxin-like family protein n=1 Tax=Methylocaldum sp. GT1TLB TaxID=3438965 RepID=UPI003DA07D55
MLNQQIRETIQFFRENLPADLSALIEQGAGEISALDIIEQAKKAGDQMPGFALKNQHSDARSLAEYLAKGPLVVTFYRGVWCPYCNLQLKAYADRHKDIQAAGATLVAITPERPGSVNILRDSGAPQDVIDMAVEHVPFDVLHDVDSTVAESLGLIFELPESHRTLLSSLGVDIEALTGSSTYTFPDPATYVVKPTGEIVWAFVPNNYRKRAEVDQILDAVAQGKS